ncbi:MAG TPA: serine/threonine-protein kinase, partial [Planctomycetota bacterium]|nr:serine/threonine-protein kinase [Planctomycetota bacterium]
MADPKPDDELESVLGEITRVLESGGRIDTEQYVERYPGLAPELKRFFGDRLPGAAGHETGLAPGSVLDDFRIVREIGRGGMGVVYEAQQLSLGRRVALKVLPPGLLAGRSTADRFRREASAVARLSHPRIVAVHGLNQAGAIAYLAMEYVDGLDLAQIIDRLRTARTHGRRFVLISGPHLDADVAAWAAGRKLMGTLPGDPRLAEGIVIDLRNYAHMAAAIAADAADALRHAHGHQIVHRDIKPGNLLLAADGRIKLGDFGLAKSRDDGSLTKTGDFVGSPAYVAPEQASSRRRQVDERSDVYSLGLTLYELLTLHQPFAGKDVAVILRNILTKEPPPPTQLNPRVPQDLETIVLKAIEKDPANRYQSAAELGDDLRRFLNFEAIRARPPGPLSRVARLARRHRLRLLIAAMGAVIAGLSITLAAGALGADRRSVTVARDLSLRLERGGASPEAIGVAQVVAELTQEVSPAERRRGIDRVTEEARALLARGQYERVDDLLALVDAKTALGSWGELERQLLGHRIAAVKLDLIGALERALGDRTRPEPSASRRRALLRPLERLLLDPDARVCKNAAVALSRVGGPSTLGALVDA